MKKPESGLPEYVDVKIVDAYFDTVTFDREDGTTDARNQLHWEVMQSFDDGETWKEFGYNYGIGKGWDIVEGGKTVVHETGNSDKTFHANSAMGTVITAVLDLEGTGLDDADEKDAAIWVGKSFKLKRTEFVFKKLGITTDRMIPCEYLGDGGGTAAAPDVDSPVKLEVIHIAQEVAGNGGDEKSFKERVFSEVSDDSISETLLTEVWADAVDLVS